MPDEQAQFQTDDGALSELFNSAEYEPDGVGLALSGGGYKAAAYHLGALIRLEEVGALPKINRISSVSGGSIAAGFLGFKWDRLGLDPATGRARNFEQEFVEPLREFLTEVNLDVAEAVLGLLLPFRSGADGVAAGYAKHLFGKAATLQSLPDEAKGAPRFVLLATNYELNSLWRFSRAYAADYRVGRIDAPTFSLARIVAASSAFPPFFCPLELDLAGHTVKATEGADCGHGRFLERALLADGGIYDNMGLEPLVKRYGALLISNAGNEFDEESEPRDWFNLLRRVIGMIHRQAENNRQRTLMILARAGARKVAYWPLRNANRNYPDPSPVRLSDEEVAAVQAEPVRLWSLGAKAFARIANHGYSLCDSALRSYWPSDNPPAARLPF